MSAPESPNWGIELWDQYEKISTHTQNGAHFLENFQAFIKERALIEFEYADKLRKMARKYQPKKTRGQGQEDEETNFSTHVAFNKMLEEVAHLANQHEIISEELIQNIAKEIAGLVRELKDERKRLLGEGTKLQQNLQNYVAQMDKCQKAYGKAHREAEKAHEKYERAEKDMHLSRAEVEIAKQSSVAKNQLCEDAKAEYAAQLQKTNELQRMHFNEYMPRVFNDLQQMDERRITCIQNFMKQVAESQLKVEPIIHNCLNGIMAAAGGIDAVKDSERVVETYKSGFFPPDDFPFENLSEEKPNGASLTYSSSTSGVGHKDKLTIRGTLSGKTKKRNILANIFGQTNKNNNEDAKEETWIDLPPNQRKKKIQKKLKDVRSELEHETNQRDGLHKMRRTYEENPNLGDAASLNAESERCNRRIESLHEQVQKLQSLLNEIESSTPDTAKRHSGHTRGNSIISEDTGSLSRSNSDESNIHNNSGTQRIMSAAANAKNVLSKATNGISAVKHSLSRNNSASSGSTNSSQAVTPLTPTSPSTHSACLSAASGALLANMTNMSNGSHGLVGDTSVSTCSGPLSPASNGHHHITPIEEEGGGAYTTNGDHAAYNSESGVGSGSLRDIDDPEFEDHHEEDETLPPLGTAIALYTFEAENEGAIAMTENDEMYIVELDQGDGWTRVRMRSTGEEGFVPSSYIEISMYNTC